LAAVSRRKYFENNAKIVVAKKIPPVSMLPRWSELRCNVNNLTISFLHVAPMMRDSLRAAAEDF
jgi:hypothetical protein